jgi:hypothetical protein
MLWKESEESEVASERLPKGSMNLPQGGYVKGLCCKETKEFCGKGVERRIVHGARTKESWKARRTLDVGKGNKEAT